MGTTLSILSSISRRIPNGKKFKAVQTGGPSGGCLPVTHLNLAVDYETLARSRLYRRLRRVMVIMDEDSCMVDIAGISSPLPRTSPAVSALCAAWVQATVDHPGEYL